MVRLAAAAASFELSLLPLHPDEDTVVMYLLLLLGRIFVVVAGVNWRFVLCIFRRCPALSTIRGADDEPAAGTTARAE